MKLSGIVKIDTQHSMLFGAIKDARIHSMDATNLLFLLNKLASYVAFHFNDEEKFMKVNNIPGYDTHVLQHRWFQERVKCLLEDFSKTGVPSDEILTFAEDWLINHINVEADVFREYALRK